MDNRRLAVAGPGAWKVWLRTILDAVAANLLIRLAALTVYDIAPEFEPLATIVPTVFLTVVGVTAGLTAALAVERGAEHPPETFRRIVVVVLLISLVPDLLMLTESGGERFPGADLPAVATLMLQHVAAAAIVLWRVDRPSLPC